MELQGKKLVVLGGVAMICELVENAKNRGAYVIVADYYSNSPAKKVADQAWLISTADTEQLAVKCIENGVDGVIAAFDDFNVACAQKLSEKIKKPFYATAAQVEATMDKVNFKKLCKLNDVPSTPEFEIDDELSQNCLDKINYPVIIKPVDGSGARGITICYSEKELIDAYKKAKSTSKKGNVILEKYIVGDEIGVNYVLQDGEISATVLHDRYMQKSNGNSVRLPVAYVYPSKYTEKYLENDNQKVIAMFKSIGMENGTLFLQGCMENEVCYFYEMGYRLNGAKQYQILNDLCGFNPMEMIVNFSLTGKMEEHSIKPLVNPMLSKVCCTLSILAKPGYISKITGLDRIKALKETLAVTQWYKEGESIDEDALGTQKQIAMRITVATEDRKQLARVINQIYEILDILDDKQNSILIDQFDTTELLTD